MVTQNPRFRDAVNDRLLSPRWIDRKEREALPSHLTDLLTPDNIQLGVSVKSKSALFSFLAERASLMLGIDAGSILDALSAREALESTGVGRGYALPHATNLPSLGLFETGSGTKIDGLAKAYISLTRLETPIEFHARDGEAVDLVVTILTPSEHPQMSARVTALAAKILRSQAFLTAVRRVETPQQAYAALVEIELFGATTLTP